MTLSEELSWRGFINQTTYKSPTDLDKSPITFYWGVDPSADSMTIGNLAVAMMVRHFIQYGHRAVLLVGGATGLIGDPDGKSSERQLAPVEEIVHNKANIGEQYKNIFAGESFEIVDNYDWFKDFGYLEFLRKVGKHVPLRQMVGRDFVQKRVGESGSGISYAEFSYSLIQAYDFLHLHQTKGVGLQVCGADQWGNCIAGVDLIRRITGDETHVWSAPLILNKATGLKFGKSEQGAIWLDERKTSVYQFYQFWLNVDDEGVEEYLKIYTLLDKAEIASIMVDFNSQRQTRVAQKKLAYEVTKLIHGEQKAKLQEKIAKTIAGESSISELDDSEISVLTQEIPFVKVEIGKDSSIINALTTSGLAASNSEARRLIDGGAVYINNEKLAGMTDFNKNMGHVLLIRRGKAFKDSAVVQLD